MTTNRKPGRKPSGLPKKIRVNIALTEGAREMLHKVAAREKLSASAWLEREIIRAYAKK